MTVMFHGSFGLNRKYMAGVLSAALKKQKVTDLELGQKFGYKAPFGQRYRSWLHKTGLAEMGMPIKLTPLGEVVCKTDSSFSTTTTQWFLFHELTGSPERAEPWHYFVHEFLPANKTFSKNDLLEGLIGKLRYHSEMHFGPGGKLNPVICRKIIECFTEDYALGPLGIIFKDGTSYTRVSPKNKMGPWKNPAQLAKAY